MHRVHDNVLSYIADPHVDDFERLALEIFAHQFEYIPAYRRVCERRNATPDRVASWTDIPPVPALAFKQVDLCCAPPQRVFLSSGTSQGSDRRSRHAMADLRLYQASAIAGLRTHVFADVPNMSVLSLVPRAAEWPDSSLAQMVSWAMESFGDSDDAQLATQERLDFDGFSERLRRSERTGMPVCIMTTTAALIRFLDDCRDRDRTFRLPHSSRLMDTGGAKGAPRILSRNGILQAVWNTLAIPGYFVVNEYGMSELSSQYYDNVIRDRWSGRFSHRAKVGPHWMRTRFLDPATLRDVPVGEAGLLCHVDLANAGSALAVLTEDIGRASEHGFEVIGRAIGAEARGCSLAMAEFRT
ncbi:MAG: long-chain fatty acid--CoA ligase [Deltaproteobacteria bacterium]|nr:long-chain fatty acid--CoA ligase [Deltaproteobacteria bacterium]